MPLSPNPGSGLDQRLGLGIALDLPTPSTPPRQRARSSSPPGKRGRSTTPASVSPGLGRFFPGTSSQTASPRPDQGYGSPNPGGYEPVGMSGGVKGVGKAVAGRMLRTVRRGNLPFLIVFVSCLILFTTSLAGIGYVAPEELTRTIEFLPGTPVFDLAGRQALERRMQEQKALENEWAKKKRPKDGAWMQRARDDRAIRRKPTATATATATSTDTSKPPAETGVPVPILEDRPPPVQVELEDKEKDAES